MRNENAETPPPANAELPLDLDDDTPLACPMKPADDQPCESCQ